MTLYAYCIRRVGDPPPDASMTGLNEVPVRLLEHGDLGVWLSPSEVGTTTPERLREHDRVVRHALRTATPLPLRFGSTFADEPAVRAALDARREEFRATLERVAGRVEMAVTVEWDAGRERAAVLAEHPEMLDSQRKPTSGREYLEHRRRAAAIDATLRVRADELLRRVEHTLCEGDALPTIRAVLPRPEVAGTLAQLVPRNAVAEYRRRFDAAQAQLPEVPLALSGPWGPYSFV